MPEESTAVAPAPEAEVGGINDFTASLAATVKSASTPKAEPVAPKAEPVAKATEPAAVKAEPTAKVDDKSTTAAPKEKPMAEWTSKDFDDAMKKAPSKAWKVYEFHKTKTESKIAELEKKISETNSKPVESAADAKRIEAYEKQIKELGEQTAKHLKTISELDYSRSPEFKKQYTDKLASTYENAVKEFTQLTVTDGDNTRPATQQDFDELRKLSPAKQATQARAMLGDGAEVFFAHRNEINRIQREGREALANAQEQAEVNRIKAEAQTKEQDAAYNSQFESEKTALISQFPDLFGDTDNQEVASIFEKAAEFARKNLSERNTMTPQDRAALDAAMVMSHAGFRRLIVEGKDKDTEIENLKTALAKYQKSDPGADTTGKAPAAKDADDVGGIEQMASVFKKVA